MIKCPYCNDENPDGAVVCGSCGHKLSTGSDQPIQTGDYHFDDPSLYYPMKWYKFLIYFDLIAGFILNIIGGLGRVTGFYLYGVYGEDYYYYLEAIAKESPAFRWADVVFGLLTIGIAFLMIITRYRLNNYMKSGPLFLYLTYLSVIVVNILAFIIYGVLISRMSGGFKYDFAMLRVYQIVNSITTLIILICNIVYFRKRKELFVN